MPGYATMSEAKRAAILDYVLNHKPPSPSRPEPGEPAPKVIDKQPPAYAFGGFRRWLDDEGCTDEPRLGERSMTLTQSGS